MRAPCQSYSPQNSSISGTATKHKDVNTLKVNSRTNHFYCFAHLWRRLDVSVKAKLPVKMWNVTFEATYHTSVRGKFIYFIERLFYLQPQIFSTSTIGFNERFFCSFRFFPDQSENCSRKKLKGLLRSTPPSTMKIWGMASAHEDPFFLVASCIPWTRMQRRRETSSEFRERKTRSDRIPNQEGLTR